MTLEGLTGDETILAIKKRVAQKKQKMTVERQSLRIEPKGYGILSSKNKIMTSLNSGKLLPKHQTNFRNSYSERNKVSRPRSTLSSLHSEPLGFKQNHNCTFHEESYFQKINCGRQEAGRVGSESADRSALSARSRATSRLEDGIFFFLLF